MQTRLDELEAMMKVLMNEASKWPHSKNLLIISF
jgi:hypothetical protein